MSPAPAIRDEFLDYLKGWLIFLVVWGHAIQYLAYLDNRFWSDPVYSLIYSFHMPLFMAVSGYLTHGSIARHGGGGCVRRRLHQLVLPILCWSLIYRIFLAAGTWPGTQATSLPELLVAFGSDLLKETWLRLWFLWALFFATLLTAGLQRLRLEHPVVMIVVTLAVFFLPDGSNLALFKNTLPFFFIGYTLARLRPSLPAAPPTVWLIAGLVASAGVMVNWQPVHHVYLSGALPELEHLPVLAYRFAAAVVVSATFLLLVQRLHRMQVLHGLLIGLGRQSLGIYLLQTYCFTGIRWIAVPMPSLYLDFFLALPAALVITLGLGRITTLIEHSRRGATWLLGRSP